eukprot:scaffold1318_cov388-Prasinococcus_capsulatus_cf.AAC.42
MSTSCDAAAGPTAPGSRLGIPASQDPQRPCKVSTVRVTQRNRASVRSSLQSRGRNPRGPRRMRSEGLAVLRLLDAGVPAVAGSGMITANTIVPFWKHLTLLDDLESINA